MYSIWYVIMWLFFHLKQLKKHDFRIIAIYELCKY